jgi:hypothetical protein
MNTNIFRKNKKNVSLFTNVSIHLNNFIYIFFLFHFLKACENVNANYFMLQYLLVSNAIKRILVRYKSRVCSFANVNFLKIDFLQ